MPVQFTMELKHCLSYKIFLSSHLNQKKKKKKENSGLLNELILSRSSSEPNLTKGKLRNDYLWTEKAEILVALDTVFSSLSCSSKD